MGGTFQEGEPVSIRRQERRRGERQARILKAKQALAPKKGANFFDRLSADWIAGLIIGGVVLVIALVFLSSWFFSTRAPAPAPFTQVFALTVNGSDANRVLIGDASGLYISNDAGKKWSQHVITDPVRDLYVDPSNPSTVYALGGQAVRRSLDGGLTWAEWRTNLPQGQVTALAADPAAPTRMYAYVDNLGLYRSDDSGTTWSRQNPLADASLSSLAVKAGQPDTLFAFHDSEGLVASTDGGRRFDPVQSQVLPHRSVSDILTYAQEPETFYAVADQAVYKSTDGGKTWAKLENGLNGVSAVAIDRSPMGRLYVTDFSGNVYQSADGGASWQKHAVSK
jgi:photosystem II stability/assembly factor-like uncharacterized protein